VETASGDGVCFETALSFVLAAVQMWQRFEHEPSCGRDRKLLEPQNEADLECSILRREIIQKKFK
jgi:hypothetical protein